MSSESVSNNMELDTLLKKRLYQLMTAEEQEQPFSFATRVGLGKSTFHSIWTKGSTSIHKATAKKIADATGANVDWIHKGVGEPYSANGLKVAQEPAQAAQSLTVADTDGVDMAMMIEALTIVEDHLTAHNKRMDNDKKAELIVSIYDLLCKSPDASSSITTMLKLAV